MCKIPRPWLMFFLVLIAILLLILESSFPGSIYKDLSGHKIKLHGTSKSNSNSFLNNIKEDQSNNLELQSNKYCEVIHVGIVCAGYKYSTYLHTLLKSIYFYRLNPIHFHILTKRRSEKVLQTLFNTWNVPQSNVTFYDINDYILDIRWVPNYHYSGVYGLLKLVFPKIISLEVTDKIIVLDTDLIFTGDILELWKLFKNFTSNQAIGIVENESNYYLTKSNKPRWPAIGRGYNSGLILYDLPKLKRLDWPKLWSELTKKLALIYGFTDLGDQDVINTVLYHNPDLIYEVPCYWNTQLSDNTLSHNCYNNNKIKVIHWNSPKKLNVINKDAEYFLTWYSTFQEYNGNLLRRQLHYCNATTTRIINYETSSPRACSDFEKTSQWRTLLFFRDYTQNTEMEKNDITFIAHLSYDRLQLIEELVRFWSGPISFTLYVTDPEFDKSNNFIKNLEILQNRENIAFHAVFKEGELYPINLLRNVGLKNVDTPYVFLADIDFIPMRNLYEVLKTHIITIKNMKKKALIVPAFETQRYRSRIPKNKIQLLEMWKKKTVFPFRSDVWAAGHAPTNYTKWKSATTPYTVKWEPDFEPYVVVRSDVTEYDNRFMGFGWNKVSHIMELEAQGYEFIVLPNAFIIHKSHAPSYDIAKFRTSQVYRMCLQNLKQEYILDLNKKYGRVFDNRNSSLAIIK